MKPVRLQLSRSKGFNLQETSRATNGLAAIPVARPGKWGNPFTSAEVLAAGQAATVREARAMTIERFRAWIETPSDDPRRAALLADIGSLKGHNLACWCSLDGPCHAAILLDLANRD